MTADIKHIDSSQKRFSALMLKIAAILGMTANHTAVVFGTSLPDVALCVLTALGGLTFPVMAYLLIEGYRHTSSFPKYVLRLAVFALIAQVPYYLALSESPADILEYGALNVLFTLLLCLALIYAYDHMQNRYLYWALFAIALAASALCDWGLVGPVLVLLFHTQKSPSAGLLIYGFAGVISSVFLYFEGALLVEVLSQVLYYVFGFTLAFVLMRLYNGQRGPGGSFHKWFFYVYYPAHLLVLWLIATLL
ncbi:MAG: conjugal transfer protein TraX [Eggerthellaceae bacterium]|nr:conjugal transfer protein TraX [Eggerthellaceae bacterium]